MSHIEEVAKDDCEMQMTPMIDVTFLLLIFFMCTLKFKTLEGKLAAYLPKDVGVNTTDAEPIEKVEILIEVEKEGTKIFPERHAQYGQPWDGMPGTRYEYGKDRKLKYSVGARKTNDIKVVERELRIRHDADEERPATIDARPGTVYADVVRVLDAALAVEFKEITFVGSYE